MFRVDGGRTNDREQASDKSVKRQLKEDDGIFYAREAAFFLFLADQLMAGLPGCLAAWMPLYHLRKWTPY